MYSLYNFNTVLVEIKNIWQKLLKAILKLVLFFPKTLRVSNPSFNMEARRIFYFLKKKLLEQKLFLGNSKFQILAGQVRFWTGFICVSWPHSYYNNKEGVNNLKIFLLWNHSKLHAKLLDARDIYCLEISFILVNWFTYGCFHFYIYQIWFLTGEIPGMEVDFLSLFVPF